MFGYFLHWKSISKVPLQEALSLPSLRVLKLRLGEPQTEVWWRGLVYLLLASNVTPKVKSCVSSIIWKS